MSIDTSCALYFVTFFDPQIWAIKKSIKWLLEIRFKVNWMDWIKIKTNWNCSIAEITITTSSWTKSAPFRGNVTIRTNQRSNCKIFENVAYSVFQQIQWKNDDLWRYVLTKSILQRFTIRFSTPRWGVFLSNKPTRAYSFIGPFHRPATMYQAIQSFFSYRSGSFSIGSKRFWRSKC